MHYKAISNTAVWFIINLMELYFQSHYKVWSPSQIMGGTEKKKFVKFAKVESFGILLKSFLSWMK